MLTTVEMVQSIPGLLNVAAAPLAFLNTLIGAADQAVKTYLKRDVECRAYVEYYSGDDTTNIITRQWPLLSAFTLISDASNGATLPTSTIYVNSTEGFDPGTGGNPLALPPTLGVQTVTSTPGVKNWTVVTYTGITPNAADPTGAPSFTGCVGGTGTLSSAEHYNKVYTPVVFADQNGFWGGKPNSFPISQAGQSGQSSQLVYGTEFMPFIDSGGRESTRGLIKRIGGGGLGFWGFYGANNYAPYNNKLAGSRWPCWPIGQGNLKVAYSAGYRPGRVPFDIQYATAMLVAQMVRIMPNGSPLSSEGLGGYSYSVLSQRTDIPDIGTIQRTLAPYRESSWGT